MLRKLIYTSILATISFGTLSIEKNEINDLQSKASIGNTSAQLLLGQLMLTNQIDVAGDQSAKGVDLIFQAARSGNPKAQFMVGVLYERGLLGPVDLENAFIAYQDAANNGYTKSLVNMAYIKEQQGNFNEARALYSQAGDKGDSLGYLNLYVLEKREGNTKQADNALIAAAQAGNASAQHIYASELLRLDLEQPLNDASPAILWLKVAGKQGNTGAMSDLISLYDKGAYVSADFILIESFLITLSAKGDGQASFTLAKHYIKQHKSYSKAWSYLSKAISKNVEGALSYKKLLFDSNQVITTGKDIYVSSAVLKNEQLPVLVKKGAKLYVLDELRNGSVFVIEDKLGVYGFAEQSILKAAQNEEEVTVMRMPTPEVRETDLTHKKLENEINAPTKVASVLQSENKPKVNAENHFDNTNIQKAVALINRPVNFRENAHPQSKVISSLDVGDEVTFISADDWGWSQVTHEGTQGYVMSRAIDYNEK